jgi:hypothetical protein
MLESANRMLKTIVAGDWIGAHYDGLRAQPLSLALNTMFNRPVQTVRFWAVPAPNRCRIDSTQVSSSILAARVDTTIHPCRFRRLRCTPMVGAA